MKTLIKATFASVMLIFSLNASAALMLFDFEAMAAGNEGEFASGDTFVSTFFPQLSIKIESNEDPYWDNGVGLGACQIDDCSGTSEDNVEAGEYLMFTFFKTGDGAMTPLEGNFLIFTATNPSGHGDPMGTVTNPTTVNYNAGTAIWKPTDGTPSINTGAPLLTSWSFLVTDGEMYLKSISVDGLVTPSCVGVCPDIPEPSNIAVLAFILIGLIGSRKFRRS